MSLDDKIGSVLRETFRDGVLSGMDATIMALEMARPNVALENQTWESAIAFLRLVEQKRKEQDEAK